MEDYLGSAENRRIVMAWLTGSNQREISSRLLSEGDWFALREWIDPANVGDNTWVVQADFPKEVRMVLASAVKEETGDEQESSLEDKGQRATRWFVPD
jgi:hypothetical protein